MHLIGVLGGTMGFPGSGVRRVWLWRVFSCCLGVEQKRVKSFMFSVASASEPSGTSFWCQLAALGSKMRPMGATCSSMLSLGKVDLNFIVHNIVSPDSTDAIVRGMLFTTCLWPSHHRA